MRVHLSRLQKIKIGLHVGQAISIIIIFSLTLTVLNQDGGTSKAMAFMLALCCITLPALMFLTILLAWIRTKHFPNVYVYAATNVTFTVMWLAATIAVRLCDDQNICLESKQHPKEITWRGNDSTDLLVCGTSSRRIIAEAIMDFALFVLVLFAVTSGISLYGILQARRTSDVQDDGVSIEQSPGLDARKADPCELELGRVAYSSCMSKSSDERQSDGIRPDGQPANQGIELLVNVHNMIGPQTLNATSRQQAFNPRTPPHPGRPTSFTSRTPSDLSIVTPAYDEHLACSALSPGCYEQSPKRVDLPMGGHYGEMFR
ncbi:hypothetical protein LTR27_008448 [Elasticomyces elasticus]|nr:hypothetical protein LTR27_008448 [Elasticomyces elasticus]